MKLSRLLAPFLFLFAPLCLHAQLGLYGAFTAQNLGGPNNNGYDYRPRSLSTGLVLRLPRILPLP
jgi:hypothetical protein